MKEDFLKNSAFTLTEMLVGLVICAIIILIISAIGSIGFNTYENLRSESNVYNDMLYYGFDLMKKSVRQAHSVTTNNNLPTPSGGSWVGAQALIADNDAFAVFRPVNKQTLDLVYLKDRSDPDVRDIIFFEADNLNLVLTQEDSKIFTVNINGNKGEDSFDLTTSITKRN